MLRNTLLPPIQTPARDAISNGRYSGLYAGLRSSSYRLSGRRSQYSDLFALTRPGSTTVWTEDGRLSTVPAGKPALGRIGQEIVTFPATNYCRSSNTLTYWEAQGATIESGAQPVPFVAGMTVDVLKASAGHSLHGMRSTTYINRDKQTRYTYIVRPENIRRVGWGRYAIDGAYLIVFDFETASVVQDGSDHVNGSIEALPDGWFKISFTLQEQSTTTAFLPRFYFLPPDLGESYRGTNSSWQTQGNERIAFFFLQATDGDVDLPLIYTTNTQETRPGDDLQTLGDPRDQPYWNSNGLTVVMRARKLLDQSCMFLYGGSSGRRLLYQTSAGTGYSIYDGETATFVIGPDSFYQHVTMAFSITPTTKVLSIAGVSNEGSHNGNLLTDTNMILFGKGVYNPQGLSIERFEIIEKPLSAAQLDAITGATP